MKQSDKLTAYYFRAAQQIDTLYLDNQMQKLLYHASQNGIAAFALYVDNGYNGLNFNRPAFSLMQQDMSDGRISKIVATSLDRISRNSLDVLAFCRLRRFYGHFSGNNQRRPCNAGLEQTAICCTCRERW